MKHFLRYIRDLRDLLDGVQLRRVFTAGLLAEFTEAHGLRGAVPAHTIRYGYLSVIVKAAVAGLGFALVPRCFVREELLDRSLLELPELRFESGGATG